MVITILGILQPKYFSSTSIQGECQIFSMPPIVLITYTKLHNKRCFLNTEFYYTLQCQCYHRYITICKAPRAEFARDGMIFQHNLRAEVLVTVGVQYLAKRAANVMSRDSVLASE